MKIVVAPDSFKGSLTAQQAADAIEIGIRRVLPQANIVTVPMADGGEGTVQSLVDATGGYLVTAEVVNPLGKMCRAQYGFLGNTSLNDKSVHDDTTHEENSLGDCTAVIEMAQASGIQFVNELTMNPLTATTYGTGQLIKDALDRGATKIIVGLGGSATNDGGAGMAQALGVHLKDADGNELDFGGAELARLESIDCSQMDERLKYVEIILASDVTNPLTGSRGASAVFGPQKGASDDMIMQLDAALMHYAKIIREQCGRDVENIPGSGAAGGLGAGFLAFTRASIKPGVSVMIEATHLKEKAVGADLCITGEGGIDSQTQYGKTPLGVAQAVKDAAQQCTVIALAGKVGSGAEILYDMGIDAIFGIIPGVSTMSEAIEQASENVSRMAENVVRLVHSSEF
ncbi:glycerate kinase [Alloscardovia theropitheci]|uniref:Glycerate kinase n=1 Tax=Alloscardovia theropitheci TaxID=2496842 RepID=A0A4R0QUX1_9BIFI|nr:glycerate kinase [Alloscardovia theropitheci]TCD53877.1 glycerate kinase [Alloscardovia theropitheci]